MSDEKISRKELNEAIRACRLALELDGTIPATEVSAQAIAAKGTIDENEDDGVAPIGL